MPGYIDPVYEEIEKELSPFVQEHDLDLVTVNSLIRGSIEILEPEMPTDSWGGLKNNLSSGIDIKCKNIKINLKFALDSIFSLKYIFDANKKWLILTILKAIVFLLGSMKIELDNDDTVVLFCIYRLRSATTEEITNYAKKLQENKTISNIQINDISKTLKNLEDINSIKLEDGKYSLCETISIIK